MNPSDLLSFFTKPSPSPAWMPELLDWLKTVSSTHKTNIDGVEMASNKGNQSQCQPPNTLKTAMYQTLTPAFIKHFQGNRLKTEDAQDLAQDAILRVFDKLHTVTDHAAVMGWIWRVAKNQALTFHRTEKSRQKYTPSQGGILNNGDSDSKVDKDHEIDLGQGSPYEIDRQRNTPETALCMRQQFAKFLEDHPARARLIIAIVEDGLEGDDLAQWLGRTPRATDQYKSQTKLKLDAYLNVCITD